MCAMSTFVHRAYFKDWLLLCNANHKNTFTLKMKVIDIIKNGISVQIANVSKSDFNAHGQFSANEAYSQRLGRDGTLCPCDSVHTK